MTSKAGWAEPTFVISEPRIQKAAGFHYFYAEEKNIKEIDALRSVRRLLPKVQQAYHLACGNVNQPALLVMFIDLPESGMYDVQCGYGLEKAITPCGEAHIRRVKATLVAGILVWGTNWSVPKSYRPLEDFMKKKGYQGVVGWREWHIYAEGDYSKNNVTWVQHEVKEVG